MLTITNHGPLIESTDYWQSDWAKAGKLYCSVNAGAIRVLLPPKMYNVVGECRSCRYVVLSRGPWPAEGLAEAVHLMFEDESESPYCLTLAPESFDMLPAKPEAGKEWIVTLWVLKKGRPQKALERPCKWRRSAALPDMSAYKG